MYKVFSSGLSATPLVVEPCGASGYSDAVNVSITFFVNVFITETELSFELATNKYFPFCVMHKSFGLSPTLMVSINFLWMVLKTYTLSQPQQVMYNCFLSGDNRQVYVSPPNGYFPVTFLVFRFTMYKELFSLVTTYIRFFASSISIPAGEILLGHFLPSIMLSFKTNFLFTMAYFNIQLLLPPEAYKNFSSALNLRPIQHSVTTILSITFPLTASIS